VAAALAWARRSIIDGGWHPHEVVSEARRSGMAIRRNSPQQHRHRTVRGVGAERIVHEPNSAPGVTAVASRIGPLMPSLAIWHDAVREHSAHAHDQRQSAHARHVRAIAMRDVTI
jgi:hypothetical protein